MKKIKEIILKKVADQIETVTSHWTIQQTCNITLHLKYRHIT